MGLLTFMGWVSCTCDCRIIQTTSQTEKLVINSSSKDCIPVRFSRLHGSLVAQACYLPWFTGQLNEEQPSQDVERLAFHFSTQRAVTPGVSGVARTLLPAISCTAPQNYGSHVIFWKQFWKCPAHIWTKNSGVTLEFQCQCFHNMSSIGHNHQAKNSLFLSLS